MSWNRAVSLLTAAAWLLFVCATRALREAVVPCLLTAAACLVPIWYGDALGSYVPPGGRSRINRPSPGWLVKLFGWLFLAAAVRSSIRAALPGRQTSPGRFGGFCGGVPLPPATTSTGRWWLLPAARGAAGRFAPGFVFFGRFFHILLILSVILPAAAANRLVLSNSGQPVEGVAHRGCLRVEGSRSRACNVPPRGIPGGRPGTAG